jgi:hypothetical protein
MTRAEVAEKALDLLLPTLGQKRAQQLIDTVLSLETVEKAGLALRPLLQS